MFLILIETTSNQRYIFATNKLRENVGASELTYQIGTKIVMEAIGKREVVENDADGNKLRTFLLDALRNPFLDKDSHQIEVIAATSGKALLLTDDFNKAKEIVGFVTKHALKEMPGLTVHGAIVGVEDTLTDVHDRVSEVHRKLEEVRYQIPNNLQRFQRLPFVEPCATSGLPANEIYRHESLKTTTVEPKPHSCLSISKQQISNQGRNRLEKTVNTVASDINLPTNINDLEKTFPDTNWLAIVHADGNGLGEIFMKFDQYITYPTESFDGRTYINEYRKFSLALDECTIRATGKALINLQREVTKPDSKHKSQGEIPFIPLILGGDDLTIICDGEYAIKFTYDFLTEFEEQTSQNGLIKSIANKAFGADRLGICAGVVIIKPHYPFHQAYNLAKGLIKSAKQVKTKVVQSDGKQVPCSAMDFHVLYDSSSVELGQIREKLFADNGKTYLYAKPYILTEKEKLAKAVDKDWLENRTWEKLETRVWVMKAKDSDAKNKLPNSQLHHIREMLFRGRAETDSEINLFKPRYKDKGFGELLCGGNTLFFNQNSEQFTHFLDALDVVELWRGFSDEKYEEFLKEQSTQTEGQDEQ